ncbi:MAG: DUF2511 domain-containing protein [Bacteroidota bacterium]
MGKYIIITLVILCYSCVNTEKKEGRAAPISSSKASKILTKVDFEKQGFVWALKPDEGYIKCRDNAIYFETVNGVKYGLNGIATKSKGYKSVDPIWLLNEKLPGTKLSIVDMIDFGLKKCK